MSARTDYDLLIAGGGNVGAALAVALMQADNAAALRIAVVDPTPPRAAGAAEPDVGLRVSALSPGSRHFLEHLGAWPQADRRGPTPYQRMQVEDASGRGRVDFSAHEYGLAALGWIVDNQQLRACLWQRMHALGIRLLSDCTVQSCQPRRRALSCQLSDGREVRTALLVAADGVRSPLRTQLEIAVNQRDYHQQAVVAVVETAQANPGIAWQRYLEAGPLALLPVSEGRSSLVWSLPAEAAQAQMKLSDGDFAAALGAASQYRFGPVSAVGPRASFPLGLMLAQRYAAERAVLVGDAAHQIHPQAGLGLNLGLQDAAALAELLHAGLSENTQLLDDDLAVQRLLRRYERWRRSDDEITVRGVDTIGRLLLGQGLLPQLAGFGFALVNRMPALKELFLRQACGLNADAPAWFRHGPTLSPSAWRSP